VIDSAFGFFSSWTPGRWDNPLSYDLYLSRDTCNTEVYLGFDLCIILGLCSHLSGCDNLFWSQKSYFRLPAAEV
jgi:hypothetical protein